MHLDDGFDVVMLLFWIVIGILSCSFCYGIIVRNMAVYTLPDKSSLTGVVDNTPNKYRWTVRDYMLMMVVADEYCPDPAKIDIKIGGSMADTLLEFDDDYLLNMEGRLQKYYIAYLNGKVDYEITGYDYYYDRGVPGRWRFTTR